jgi:hypothetical protein
MAGSFWETACQPNPGRFRPHSLPWVSPNGGAVRVRPHLQISDTAPARVAEGKDPRRVEWLLYVPGKKWKVIRRYNTSTTAQLNPKDRKHDQYQQK